MQLYYHIILWLTGISTYQFLPVDYYAWFFSFMPVVWITFALFLKIFCNTLLQDWSKTIKKIQTCNCNLATHMPLSLCTHVWDLSILVIYQQIVTVTKVYELVTAVCTLSSRAHCRFWLWLGSKLVFILSLSHRAVYAVHQPKDPELQF